MNPGPRLSWVALLLPLLTAGGPAPGSVHAAPPSDIAPPPPEERIGDAWSDPRNPIVRLFNGRRLNLWSLRAPRRPSPPPRARLPEAARHNPIDAFVHDALAERGLAPAPEADRRTLARRVSMDLTGLPPSPEEVERFIADEAPDAYERMIDRLLASPRYGEHQARLWLDVIRYSDSNGFDWDEFRPQAWRFRDYVVRAFNSDKPFDEFIREQLAGDELLDHPPRTPEDQDRLIATGYLRIGPQDNSASLFNEQARARAEWLADLTETTASAFLGLTFSCCRCHDHKHDPLSQADHFRLRAFFEPITYADDVPLDLEPEQERIRQHNAAIDARIKPLAAERKALLDAAKDRLRASPSGPAADAPDSTDASRSGEGMGRPVPEPTDEAARKAFTDEEKAQDEALRRRIAELEADRKAFTHGLLATDTTDPVSPTRILFQGDPAAPREEVPPGFPSALDPNPADIIDPPNPRTTGRRLTLANWIASPDNPFTARVFVNRAWQNLFGRGIVATPNDFGLAGAPPVIPELLDWLACDFVESGWSVKALHRRIVTSAVYRQAAVSPATPAGGSAGAGANEWFQRQNLRRLSAEQLRDSMLAVAGVLQHRAGGKPVWPELPEDILRANPAFLDDNAEKTKGWYPSPPAERTVRTLYLVQKRTVRLPFLEAFDLPDNSVSCPTRTVSIVAPQALALMNSAEAVLAAEAFARRVAAEAGPEIPDQVRRAFELALQRKPDPHEAEACQAFLQDASLAEFCRALLNLNEFAFID